MTDEPRLTAAMTEIADRLEETLVALLPRGCGPEARVFQAMAYATLDGGKRLRPFLTVETARLFGVPDSRSLRAGAAIEFVHCYSLVHDDLPAMDDDDLRRGRPSNHVEFDEATAILAGDALQTLAFEVLANPATHPDGAVRAGLVAGLADAAGARGMVGGQMFDIAAETAGGGLTLEQIVRLQRMKTGRLFDVSCQSGALLGGASESDRAALAAYTEALGLAFQIADDILDETGDAVEIGKQVGKDARAGKATFISILGLEAARERANILALQAVTALECFGERAGLLRDAAQFAVGRRT
ncbi:MAG: polyprenyl synthetase family protein [Rhodospirillaceae bacterium]|nr:polyprenyl synthetase family protein [Rhodospirillaceae bacterium]MYH37515.1 polyprenyl synthetase family protein [Rhodospirillaceae bacterium]MYK16284.1 polyprenyl synthetase family protein [Rhodospirillaceae bacterium]MYK57240.1 polyprenyl synthetase family protein [Rhodospirillaceae bacterium]